MVSPSLAAQPLSKYRDGLILPFSTGDAFYPEFQDQLGYLWGKDEQGRAVRFDGYELETFQATPFDSSGLQCNGSTHLSEDSQGNIWFAVGSCGLDRYDPQTGRFERLHRAFHEVREVPAQFYFGVYEDSRQDIWIRAQRQLFKYTADTRKFEKVSKRWHLYGILENDEDQVWALDPFLKRKFYKVFPAGGTVEYVDFPFIGDPGSIAQFPVVPQIVSPGPNIHLIAFGGHLYRFDSRQRAARPLTTGLEEGELVYTVFHDGITLVGTNRHRILEYDDRSGKFSVFLELPKLPEESGQVEKIFRSRDGLLWVVTSLQVFRVLPRELPFRKQAWPEHIRLLAPGGKSERLISFKGKIYFHTQNGPRPLHPDVAKPLGPLLRKEDFRLPPWRPGGKGLAPEKVKEVSGYKFVEIPDGSGLWLVVYHYPFGTTMLQFDTTGQRVYDYYCRGREACFNDHMQEVDIAPDGRMWIAGWAGLSCFNPEDQTFTNFRVKEGLPERTAIAVHCTRDSSVWVGFNSGGLVRYDPAADCFDYYTYDENELGSLSSDHGVCDIHEDRHGNLWVATSNGLNRYDPQSNTFEFFNEKDGLPAPEVYTLAEDRNGGLWVNTQRHLSRYQRKQGVFYSYGKADGLPDGGFTKRKPLQDRQGRLYFHFSDGVLYFHPDSVVDSRVPELRLRSLQLANQTVKPGDSTGALTKPVGFTRQITLQPSQNVFTLRYAALEYIAPEEVKYAFQLEGFDPGWRLAGNLREATYTNLSPGDYRFKVKCWNRHGLEGEPIFLNITILPPWYRTTWAYLLWALLLTGLLYAAYRFQLNRQLAKQEAKRIKELEETKSRFYTNITHEFRTPLSVILGMVNQINRDPQGWLGEGLSKIRQYSFQLLRLVNQMLDLSKLEADKLPVNMIQQDVVPFLKYLVESFGSYARSREIDLQLKVEPEQLVMDYDAEKISTIVSNLLSNALKFTPAGGTVNVRVTATKDHLQVEVADTGQGIPEAQLPHIFDRFYQIDDTATRSSEGTGIGLALTKELVRLLGGRIEVRSEVGVGTAFTVFLPITQQAAAAAEQAAPSGMPEWVAPAAQQPPAAEEAAGEEEEEKPLLLIVEDNRDVIDYLATFLGPAYRVKRAENGAQGIEKARELVPNLIVSDVMMPEKDGFELCDTLKNDRVTSHIPIILLTAKSDIGSRIAGRKRGADAYLSKPFSEQELLVVIQNLLEQRQRLQAHFREGQPPTKDTPEDIQIEDAFLQQLREIVEAHIDQKIEISWLARQAHLSRSQLSRKTKALIGKPPTDFINDIRIAHSKRLLRETDQLVSEVAYAVGYDDPAYFSRVFRGKTGLSPLKWKDKGGDAT